MPPQRHAREERGCAPSNAKCISACSGSAPAIIPRLALEGAGAAIRSWPVVAARANRRARQTRPVLRRRFAGHGPGVHPVVPLALRADDADRRACAVTSRIGLGGTVSTSFSEPYNVARAFASFTISSGGRAAWNMVTTRTMRRRRISARSDQGARPALRDRRANSSTWCKASGTPGTTARSSPTRSTGIFIDESKVRAAQPQRTVFFRQRAAQHRARAARPSDHHPGRRLAARSGAVGADRRSGVLRRQRRQCRGQDRL